ncbi:MAG: tyrosine-type recombinase/integrase [Bacteroidota bacterium]
MLSKFELYISSEKRFSAHTRIAYMKDIEQFSLFLELTEEHLVEVTPSMVRSWIVGMFDLKLTKKSINRKLSSLRTFYRWLKTQGLITNNPMSKITGPKSEKRLPIFVKEADIDVKRTEQLFSTDFDGARDRLMFELLYQTGIRLSELIELKESNVSSQAIKVLGKRSKERIIPITQKLADQVDEYKTFKAQCAAPNDHLLVLINGKKLYPKFVYRKINEYLSMVANLDKASPHVLRHTFATHMLNNGAGLETLKDLLGHANLSATQVYTHTSFAQLTSIYSQAHPRGHKN